jgi:hypothetical protein
MYVYTFLNVNDPPSTYPRTSHHNKTHKQFTGGASPLFRYQRLNNPFLRERLGMGAASSGVLITEASQYIYIYICVCVFKIYCIFLCTERGTYTSIVHMYTEIRDTLTLNPPPKKTHI